VFGISSDILDKSASADDLVVFLEIVGLICFMQRWAALEWRKSRAIDLKPLRLRRAIDWYPANTFLGLLANSVLVANLGGLLSLFGGSLYREPFDSAWPHWQHLIIVLVGCPTIPIAYFWSRSEFMHYSGAIRPLPLRDVIRAVISFRSPERLAGAFAFFFLTIWSVILLLDLRFVPRIASFPDGSVGTLGFGAAWAITLAVFLFSGVIPWIAVYRGLPNLFDRGRATRQEVQRDRE